MDTGTARVGARVPRTHRNNFAFLRLAAALLVLVSHQYGLSGRPEVSFVGLHSLAGLGVLIFFSISGFLVAQSWDSDPNVLRFAARRFLRIWPAYAVNIVLTAFVVGVIVTELSTIEYWRHPATIDYLRNLWFQMRGHLPVQFDNSPLPHAANGSLWTIPLELRCYAILAALGLVGLLRRSWVVVAMAVALSVSYAGWQVRGGVWEAAMKLSIEGLYFIEFGACFLIGAALHKSWPVLSRHRVALLVTVCGILAPAAWFLGRPILWMIWTVPTLAVLIGTSSWPVLRRFDRFGDFSYGVYLYAFPIQQTVLWGLTERMHWWPRLFVVVAITVACAYVSWHVVEKKALQWKPKGPTSVPAPA